MKSKIRENRILYLEPETEEEKEFLHLAWRRNKLRIVSLSTSYELGVTNERLKTKTE